MPFTPAALTALVLEQAAAWDLRSVPRCIIPDPEGLLVLHTRTRRVIGFGGRLVWSHEPDVERGRYALAVWATEDGGVHVRAAQAPHRNDTGWTLADPTEAEVRALIGYGLLYAFRSSRLESQEYVLDLLGLSDEETPCDDI